MHFKLLTPNLQPINLDY